MTSVDHARSKSLRALNKHAAAHTECDFEGAVIALQAAMEAAFRAYLAARGVQGADDLEIGFPKLVDLVKEAGLLGDNHDRVRLLVSLNNTRNQIAHFSDDMPTAAQIAHDAGQLAQLLRGFWPALFGEQPPSLSAVQPQTAGRLSSPPDEPPDVIQFGSRGPRLPERPAPASGFGVFLRRLWADPATPRLRKGLLFWRLIVIIGLLLFARRIYPSALLLARGPEPENHIGLALFLVAAGAFLCMMAIVWKVLKQIRLKGVLIGLAVLYCLGLGSALLGPTSEGTLVERIRGETARLVAAGIRGAREMADTVLSAPRAIYRAYTGPRQPSRRSGLPDQETAEPASPSEGGAVAPEAAAPPSAEEPAPLPSAVPALAAPYCAHVEACMTAPLVNQVVVDSIRVEGTAAIAAFDYYKFEIRRADIDDGWHWLATFDSAVPSGELAVLDVAALPEGPYLLRLVVVDQVGNFPAPPCEVAIVIRR